MQNQTTVIEGNQTTNIVGIPTRPSSRAITRPSSAPTFSSTSTFATTPSSPPRPKFIPLPSKRRNRPAGGSTSKRTRKFTFYKTDIILGPKFQFALFETAISLIKLEAYGMKGSGVVFQVQLVCLKMDVKLSDNRILAMALKVSALNGHLGPIDVQAVALKLMNLAFGVNQAI